MLEVVANAIRKT